MFQETCNERIKIAENRVLGWMAINWDAIETMFAEIHCKNVIIVTRSTLKTHEQHLANHFEGSKYVVPRLRSYTHHSSDYFPKDTKYPFLMARDADMESGAVQESSQLASLAGELVNDAFFIVLQTTKKEGRIESFGPIRWLTLPRIVSENGSEYEINCIAEIAALWLFGETRFQGFLSMLWLDSRYDVIQNIENQHFAHIIQESLVSPFYLSPTISKYAIFMGFRYETYKPKPTTRTLSPVRKKEASSESPLHNEEFEPEDALEFEPEDALEDEPEDALEDEPEDALEDEPEDALEDEPEDALEDEPEPKPICPPSPKRAKLPSPFPKRRKRPKKKKGKKKTKKASKLSDTQIINPNTGRPVTIGGKVYRGLVEKGIVVEKS